MARREQGIRETVADKRRIVGNYDGFCVHVALQNVSGSAYNPYFRASARSRGARMATCPECDADLPIDEDELEEGDPVECDECGESFIVTGTDPLELELASDEDEEEDGEWDE
jgi:alpha-aminoadipate carrier protein LysW